MTKNKKIIFIGIIFLVLPLFANADTLGQEVIFNIDPSYDLQGRKEVTAILQKITNQIYFYVDKEWWEKLDSSKKQSLDVEIYNLSVEFEKNIYPKLTSTFGSEPKPGIDKDERITVLIHPMIAEAGGYFNSGDVYSKFQYPKSNEREMVYLNSQHIDNPNAKSFLAHEFTHLITANQKDLLRKVTEEIWLNEARAEYVSTFLGYDDIYQGSNLESRVKAFLENPRTSLTEWLNEKEDYGAINLFIQYLVDHYGVKILADSLQSSKVGIPSLEKALQKNGFQKNFSQVFADWLITLLVNDCKTGKEYCYLNKNLKDLRITPTLYYLPKTETIISSHYQVSPWTANWLRFIGGDREFSLEFDGTDEVEFEVPYLLCDFQNNCSVDFLTLDTKQKGKLSLSEFNTKYSSLTITPFIKSKISGFTGKEDTFSFFWQVAVKKKTQEEKEAELRKKLLAQIASLKEEIAKLQTEITKLQAEIAKLQAEKITTILTKKKVSCQRIESNLYYGMRNNLEVRCLQEFLKSQGSEIYPEGLVTGNFFSLTQSAVIRFQEKYATEILLPFGLERGTGYVGPATRTKINQFLQK